MERRAVVGYAGLQYAIRVSPHAIDLNPAQWHSLILSCGIFLCCVLAVASIAASSSTAITAAVILERALYLIGEAVMVGFETEEAGSADAQGNNKQSHWI